MNDLLAIETLCRCVLAKKREIAGIPQRTRRLVVVFAEEEKRSSRRENINIINIKTSQKYVEIANLCSNGCWSVGGRGAERKLDEMESQWVKWL